MQDSLSALVEALQQSVNRAQEQMQAYQLRMLQEYFDEENRPLYVHLRLPRLSADGKGLEYLEVDVPRLSLVKMGTVCLDELEIDFPLRIQEIVKDDGQLLVEFPGSIQNSEECAHVHVRFKSGEPPEAVMKLNDKFLSIIP